MDEHTVKVTVEDGTAELSVADLKAWLDEPTTKAKLLWGTDETITYKVWNREDPDGTTASVEVPLYSEGAKMLNDEAWEKDC